MKDTRKYRIAAWHDGLSIALAFVEDIPSDSGRYKVRIHQLGKEPLETEEGCSSSPTLHLSDTQAKQLMSRLWDCGIRPNDGTGDPAHVDSLKAHIADLRAISFKTLGVT